MLALIFGQILPGMGRYKPVRQALDYLVKDEALEVLLQKTPITSLDSLGKAGLVHYLSHTYRLPQSSLFVLSTEVIPIVR